MATYDWTGTDIIPNGSGSAVRADLNDALLALFSQNSSATAPPETVAYMTWADTSTGLYKIRNAANSGWITLYQLDGEWTTIALENGTAAAPSLYFKDSGTDTGVYSPGADQVAIATAGVQRVNFNGATEVVYNDGGADVDFRIEGDTEPNLFKIDAGTDQVQVKNLNGGPLAGTRNRIINGDMRIDQRNAGASVTYSTFQYGVDRFVYEKTNLSTLVATLQQVSDGPPGFDKSIKTTITTAQSSASNSTMVGCDQRIEGFNWADMAFGTASAKSFTMSFWVKSSVTGTYPISFFNAAIDRAYLATYTISAANTWEYKTITVAGDTSGTWNTTNGIGLGFQMSLGGGSDSEGTAGSWGSTYKSRTSACVNLNGTLNATWQVTGVQIEPGTVATPFERRSYGQELALCQRYYETRAFTALGVATAAAQNIGGDVTFAVVKRAAPTVTQSNTFAFNVPTSTSSSGITAARFLAFRGASGAGACQFDETFTASAEL